MPAMQETQVQFLGQEDPLEKEMATNSSTLAWRIPKDTGAWQATVHGVARVGHNLATKPPPNILSYPTSTNSKKESINSTCKNYFTNFAPPPNNGIIQLDISFYIKKLSI